MTRSAVSVSVSLRSLTLLASALVVTTFGCAEASPLPAAGPAPAPFEVVAPKAEAEGPSLPRSVRELALAIVPVGGDPDGQRISADLHVALVRAGFDVVADGGGSADAKIEVAVASSDSGPDGGGARISVAVRRGNENVEWLAAPVGDDGGSHAIDDIASRLSSSPRIEAFAAAVKAERERLRAAAQIMMAPSIVPQQATPGDESTWREAAARRCRNPRTADACDELAAYIQKFPDGRYADKARAVIDLSAHRIQELKTRTP